MKRPWLGIALPALLLTAFFAQTVAGIPLFNASSDETSHLPSGYTYLVTGDLRLNPQHPPLMKMLCAAPLLALDPVLDLEDEHWNSDPPEEWKFGAGFLYGNDADRLLFWGRMPVVLLALVMGFFVYRWASALFGRGAGYLALFLYAFSPTVIAHSRFVTMDIGLSCFSFLFLYFLWRWSGKRRCRDLVLAALFLGSALAAKFSAVILLPVLVTLLALLALERVRGGGEPGVSSIAGVAAVILSIAAVVVWTIYLFPLDPMFYLHGIMKVNADHDPNKAYYMLGNFRAGGFWNYFLVAFLVKTPLPTLGVLALAVISPGKSGSRRWIDEAFLMVPVAAFFVVTSVMADDIGVRYLLPVYPLLFVFASRVWRVFQGGRVALAAGTGLAIWYLSSAVLIFPDQLAYFNEAVGGPARGHEYLDDSNIDWGQDLKRLERYLDEQGVDRVKLFYPWNGDPDYYGIGHDRVTPREWYEEPSRGTYAMATVSLVRGILEARTSNVPTDWLNRYEPVDRVGYSFFIYRFDDDSGDRQP